MLNGKNTVGVFIIHYTFLFDFIALMITSHDMAVLLGFQCNQKQQNYFF